MTWPIGKPSPAASTPSLSRAEVDRVAERRQDEAWLEDAWRTGRLLVVDGDGKAAVDESGEMPSLVLVPSVDWTGDGERLLLGESADGTAYWGIAGEARRRIGTRPLGLREVGAALDDTDAGLLVTAVALSQWHATHTHCPRCGATTRVIKAGWARMCEADGSEHFPRTDPAVIVLLHDGGDRALLGRQPIWPRGRYSTIAGFVEAGESSEQCVVREVREETGVEIDDVSYLGSQPWPFPRSLMLGYRARVVGGQVETADHELEDVRWFTRDELRAGEAILPPPTSIAHWLITTWLDEGSG